MSILKRLKSIFDEMDFIGSECAIDSLMRIERDYVQCKWCSFLLFAEKDGSCNICSHALDRVLDEVV